MRSAVRDLIERLRAVADEHPAHSRVSKILANTYDHMAAIARCEEVNHEENERRLRAERSREEGA